MNNYITAEKFVKHLQTLFKQNPNSKTLPLVFASDSEGNSFHMVENYAGLAQATNLGEHYIDLEPYDKEKEPNCIIIN